MFLTPQRYSQFEFIIAAQRRTQIIQGDSRGLFRKLVILCRERLLVDRRGLIDDLRTDAKGKVRCEHWRPHHSGRRLRSQIWSGDSDKIGKYSLEVLGGSACAEV